MEEDEKLLKLMIKLEEIEPKLKEFRRQMRELDHQREKLYL